MAADKEWAWQPKSSSRRAWAAAAASKTNATKPSFVRCSFKHRSTMRRRAASGCAMALAALHLRLFLVATLGARWLEPKWLRAVGSQNIELLMGSSEARLFCHKRGVGKKKHLEIRALWLQGRRGLREEHLADMMTH